MREIPKRSLLFKPYTSLIMYSVFETIRSHRGHDDDSPRSSFWQRRRPTCTKCLLCERIRHTTHTHSPDVRCAVVLLCMRGVCHLFGGTQRGIRTYVQTILRLALCDCVCVCVFNMHIIYIIRNTYAWPRNTQQNTQGLRANLRRRRRRRCRCYTHSIEQIADARSRLGRTSQTTNCERHPFHTCTADFLIERANTVRTVQ